MKRLKPFIFLLLAQTIMYSCLEVAEPKKVDKVYLNNEFSKQAKAFVFNNELRESHGMPKLDSTKYKAYQLDKPYRIYFEKDSVGKQPFEVTFYIRDSIVADSYNIGKDSVFRLQANFKNGKYKKDVYGILFIEHPRTAQYLKFIEIMNFSKNKGLFKKGDTLFYGYNPKRFYGEAW